MLTRAPAAGALTVVLLVVSAMSAKAGGWGSVDCAQESSPYCELEAGKPGAAPGSGDRPAPGKQQGKTGQSQPEPGDRIVGGTSDSATCSYVRSDYQPPVNAVQPAGHRRTGLTGSPDVIVHALRARPAGLGTRLPPGGAWYVYRCSGPGVRDGLYRAPVWLPDSEAPAVLPSPRELAEQARAQLRLPTPRIQASPAGDQLVNLPTWLWLDRHSWGPRQATAAVPGVSVTAVATPVSVSWSTGDGGDVTCSGPGTPFPAGGEPSTSSPDCGHTYRQSSARAPGLRFPVRVAVHWTVMWSGAGASGTFPDMTTSATAAFRVAEVQALGTGRR